MIHDSAHFRATALCIVLAGVAAMPALDSATARASGQSAAALPCSVDGKLVRIAQVPAASGIAVSRTVSGRLWTHNDSGPPVLFMLDPRGSVTGQIRLSGARVDDWEAIAAGPCAAGVCLYVADIGDNRKQITIYRVAEPADVNPSSFASATDVLHATYPDGPQDAEALLATPDGSLYVVTKGRTGPIAIYRFPTELRSGASVQLEPVGQPRQSGKAREDERITDGNVSPDGEWVVLRTHRALMFHRTARLLAGDWRPERTMDLSSVGERQGEGVAFGPDGLVYLVGEAGAWSRAGTFARLTCRLEP
jgi:hypothetical protein